MHSHARVVRERNTGQMGLDGTRSIGVILCDWCAITRARIRVRAVSDGQGEVLILLLSFFLSGARQHPFTGVETDVNLQPVGVLVCLLCWHVVLLAPWHVGFLTC